MVNQLLGQSRQTDTNNNPKAAFNENLSTEPIWTKSRQIDANKNNPKAIVKDKLSI